MKIFLAIYCEVNAHFDIQIGSNYFTRTYAGVEISSSLKGRQNGYWKGRGEQTENRKKVH